MAPLLVAVEAPRRKGKDAGERLGASLLQCRKNVATCWEPARRFDGYASMPSFAIDPEIPLRHRRGVLRTIDEAREFAREMAASQKGKAWQSMLRQLERVRSEDDALEAAVALEGLLEREGVVAAETKVPAARVPLPEPEPASGPAASLVYAAAHAAAPDR